MDVVLEAFDTFLFDYLYGFVLPAQYPHPAVKNATATFSSMREAGTAIPEPYVFQPASQYFSFTPSDWAYKSIWTRDNILRQATSLFLITWLFGIVIYFVCAGLSYIFVFDKTTFNHPKFLKNQMRLEIRQSLAAFPVMAVLTIPFFVAEVRGYSKIYDRFGDAPLNGWWNIIQFPFFICFTDFFIYWIHRYLHHPLIYKHLHKPHHKWIMPSPFASHAFHPVDGWAQSVPYHVFPFLFPLQKFAYVFLFVFINIWTVLIHDGEYYADNPIINGAACHTMHHLYFNFNYGQFTTLWDRMGGSYRKPNDELFRRELRLCKSELDKQIKEYEQIVKEVEGEDDRKFLNDAAEGKKTK